MIGVEPTSDRLKVDCLTVRLHAHIIHGDSAHLAVDCFPVSHRGKNSSKNHVNKSRYLLAAISRIIASGTDTLLLEIDFHAPRKPMKMFPLESYNAGGGHRGGFCRILRVKFLLTSTRMLSYNPLTSLLYHKWGGLSSLF